MPDLVSKKEGGKVVMVSSLDENHPAENMIDGGDQSYWISTGLYPQEILLQLARPSQVSTVKISTTNVKNLRVEACAEDTPVNFTSLVEGSIEEKGGRLQLKELQCGNVSEPAAYVKVLILSGWHDFCSVHKVVVE
eukprot:CAMPEP_0172867942 /NCGR_PEP_ID=MMETSP1075-20121228/85032_1 /TAXON_ID=2916 /ORGANISM="Ceratium fusus, Strain PA161109" /LENGTH=135 /DNA_ID=CAMNT_0013717427 /DNA_START=34 /DNA_END=441 /DNA_ORIENTATION=+